MRRVLGFTLVMAVLAAACGGKGGSSPTAPTGNGSSSASAVITGSVQGTAGAFTAAGFGAAITGVTVTVVGTNISATVDAAGRFTLTNVPTGTVQLQLTGGGANATVTISTVEASQTIDVVLAVAGTSASLESEVRSGAGEAQLEGRVESLPPTMPALTFKSAGRTVKTDSSTRFVDGSQTRSFADLQIGMRIHAKGTLAGDSFTATVVEMQNSNVTVPVEVNGVIDSVTGTASAFQFKIGSRVIKGDNLTGFFGDGDKPDTFSNLKDGVRVEVKGQQRDGFVYAAWASGGNMMLHKYSNCDSGLVAQVGFPVTVSAFTNVVCPVPGLDRCNGRNILSSPKVAVDDLDANHLYYVFATATVAGNEDIMVFDVEGSKGSGSEE